MEKHFHNKLTKKIIFFFATFYCFPRFCQEKKSCVEKWKLDFSHYDFFLSVLLADFNL
jgi:hypothetical protein